MKIDHVIEHTPKLSTRARQAASMFDVEPSAKMRLEWKGEIDLELDGDWSVGLVVGPSGCGKSTLARAIFGDDRMREPSWGAPCLLDDFAKDLSIDQISKALSNGEKFRASVARRMLEGGDLVVVDEFTSVVDRQVAKCASHAVQKFVRRTTRKLVAVTCHYDVLDWLQPDWVLEPAGMSFQRRSVQRRPQIEVEVRRVPRDLWPLFAPFHYLTGKLPGVDGCFAAFIGGRPVAFTSTAKMPHARVRDIYRVPRTVVLPDWQGVGLSFLLNDAVGAAYRATGRRIHLGTSLPHFMRAIAGRANWACVKRPGTAISTGKTSSMAGMNTARTCAVFEYRGPKMDLEQARQLLEAA